MKKIKVIDSTKPIITEVEIPRELILARHMSYKQRQQLPIIVPPKDSSVINKTAVALWIVTVLACLFLMYVFTN